MKTGKFLAKQLPDISELFEKHIHARYIKIVLITFAGERGMENGIWKILYDRAASVRNERKLSPLMEIGSVGAAVLSAAGNIYTGICIDTACGMGMCAERNAIANMLTCGEDQIVKVVAVMPDGSTGTPCGVCREFMMQLGENSADIEILLSLEPLKTIKLGAQLPDWWGNQ